ncbi:hypothetical protein [Sphingobacterium sp. LRF_L2]|uniref:hypothetical protein n=1 Tax=Sphingobacterium sp. LRF_L2 TaxID=3369421 RepID=UPI003F60E66A
MVKYIYVTILISGICNFIACNSSAPSVWLVVRTDFVYKLDSIELQVNGEHEIFVDTILKEKDSRYPHFKKLLKISDKQRVNVIFNDVDTSFIVDPTKCELVFVDLTNMYLLQENPETNTTSDLFFGKAYESIGIKCVFVQE